MSGDDDKKDGDKKKAEERKATEEKKRTVFLWEPKFEESVRKAMEGLEVRGEPPPPPPLAQPKASDNNVPGYTTTPGNDAREPEAYLKAGDVRRIIGFFTLGLGSIALGVFVVWSLNALDNLQLPKEEASHPLFYAKVAAHAVISIATVWFGYQLLRAGERMSLQHWLTPDLARILIGIRGPAEESGARVKDLVALLREAIATLKKKGE